MQIALLQIWLSQDVWQKLNNAKKPVMMAYTINKYFTQYIAPEMQQVLAQRDKLVMQYGQKVNEHQYAIEPNTPEFDTFAEQFGYLLRHTIEIPQLDISFKDLLQALETAGVNDITGPELDVLEHFFQRN